MPGLKGQEWLQENKIILFLDGLDEINPIYRADCINAINAYLSEYGTLGVAVCSRTKEYEDIPLKLNFGGALSIQPLQKPKVLTYLDQSEDKLKGLRTVLKKDPNLLELAVTPLLLNIMCIAYQDYEVDDLTDESLDDVEKRRTHLFEFYISRMIERRGKESDNFTKRNVIDRLGWLGERMNEHGKTIFNL